jgi:hypothetical protein
MSRSSPRKIDAQLEKKLYHELCMQKMRNKYKQLDLDQACKKMQTPLRVIS